MNHGERCRRHEIDLVIPVADGIQAISSELAETQLDAQGITIDRKAVSSQRTRTQRHGVGPAKTIVQAVVVPLKHFEVRQQVVGEQDGLRFPEMGVARNHHILVGLGEIQELTVEIPDLNLHMDDGPLQVEARVQRHLIVPAAARVQLESGVADGFNQSRLDEAVDILCALTGQPRGLFLDALLDLRQAPANLFELFLRQDVRLWTEHWRRLTSLRYLREQAAGRCQTSC